MRQKLVSMEEAISHIKDGMTVHIGGFLACGTPESIITALVEKGEMCIRDRAYSVE